MPVFIAWDVPGSGGCGGPFGFWFWRALKPLFDVFDIGIGLFGGVFDVGGVGACLFTDGKVSLLVWGFACCMFEKFRSEGLFSLDRVDTDVGEVCSVWGFSGLENVDQEFVLREECLQLFFGAFFFLAGEVLAEFLDRRGDCFFADPFEGLLRLLSPCPISQSGQGLGESMGSCYLEAPTSPIFYSRRLCEIQY